MKLTFEDFKLGHFGTFGPHHVSRDDIIAFASEFDPQPMHLDEEAASRTILKGLSGSGWHMCSLLMRICWDGFIHNIASAGSPGVDEVRWVSPLRPGDDLTISVDVVSTRESKSRSDVGFVYITNDMRNASGQTLMLATLPLMVLRRAAAGARQGQAMPYFEDIKIGDRRELGSFTFLAEDIKKFAAKFDPQPFHLDEEAGRNSVFGGLAASGWHVAATYMRLTVASFQREAAEQAARGEKPIVSGPSPGFRELKWLKPVLAGDTLTYVSEITSKRPLESRPQFGFVGFYNTGVNQRGELAFSFLGSVFAPRRPAT